MSGDIELCSATTVKPITSERRIGEESRGDKISRVSSCKFSCIDEQGNGGVGLFVG
jgi:hypothetical protein